MNVLHCWTMLMAKSWLRPPKYIQDQAFLTKLTVWNFFLCNPAFPLLCCHIARLLVIFLDISFLYYLHCVYKFAVIFGQHNVCVCVTHNRQSVEQQLAVKSHLKRSSWTSLQVGRATLCSGATYHTSRGWDSLPRERERKCFVITCQPSTGADAAVFHVTPLLIGTPPFLSKNHTAGCCHDADVLSSVTATKGRCPEGCLERLLLGN